MSQQLQQWHREVQASQSLRDLEELRIRLLGKSGEITSLLKTLGSLAPEERKEKGAEINHLKLVITDAIEHRKAQLEEAELADRLLKEKVDVTLSIRPESIGSIHPISQVMNEIIAYFSNFGFEIASGPEIDDEDHNFSALNMPDHHPARQSHDTFYLMPDESGIRKLLRTHTSTVQIRTMRQQQPPLRILAPGRVYRNDYDATHTPMFHQIEGLVIDKGINFGHLKGTVIDFCKHFFEKENLKFRFRPSFFPFTEPSAEMDIGCDRSGGGIKFGQGNDWLEIFGCGMVHPNVLKNCGIDPEEYQGFAFGFGVDRFAMLKYGIPDLRSMFESDGRWLSYYGFSPFGGK
ncbi:MAG: phenylalanine--tRNA ligase subunit alpha [Candidatus Paracaedibacteraceae bacterium]|nr:phenylalanine--tRNA ligase subunit alpha [Candidatus Paracaedibacteraceae bacterium]